MKSVGAKVAEELSEHFRDLANYAAIDAANRQRWLTALESLKASIRNAVTEFNQNVYSGFQIQLSDSSEPFELHFRNKLTATAALDDGFLILHSKSDPSSDSLDNEYLFLILVSDDGNVSLQSLKDRNSPSETRDALAPMSVEDVLEIMLKITCGLYIRLAGLE